MKKNEILRIYGKEYTELTKRLLEEADLISEITPGMKVGIKPNLMSCIPADWGATTHPEVVAGIIEYLKEHGIHDICIMVEYLKGYLQTGLESQEVQKNHQKIKLMTDQQTNRYYKIDALINSNILQMKKGKTTDNTALIYGKEVRRIESGIRTLKLFAHDVISMLDQTNRVENRSVERIRYFEKRSILLEAEIITLTKQLSLL